MSTAARELPSANDADRGPSLAGRNEGCAHCGLPVAGTDLEGGGALFCCLGCRIAHRFLPTARIAEGRDGAGASDDVLRLGLGVFFALNVMVASWVSYSRDLFGDGLGVEQEAVVRLSATVAMFLCTLVVALLGLPLLAESVAAGRGRGPRGRGLRALGSTRTLIVIGVFSAYLLSLVRWSLGEGHLYFDTAAFLLVVVTLGGVLEASARRRASESAVALLSELPDTARVRREGGWQEVERVELAAGDLVEIRPGDSIPADGEIAVGSAWLDEATFTGEAEPRRVGRGDSVLAGSTSRDGRLEVVLTTDQGESVLEKMEVALSEARAARPAIQRLADRIASIFVPTVIALALGVCAVFVVRGDVGEGIARGLTVLLISCPCALGLAAPLTTWCGLRRAAEAGILVDSPATLERAALVRAVFFDKTGTLTEPRFDLARVVVAEGTDRDWATAAAAGLEVGSRHPIAHAFVEAAHRRGVSPLPIESLHELAGAGVEGRCDGRDLFLGSPRAARDYRAIDLETGSAAPASRDLVLADGDRWIAGFSFEESLREGARSAVTSLRKSEREVSILSGDLPDRVEAVARRLGVSGQSRLLPGDKARVLRSARSEARPVAMVGDGINDALVLAVADVGISVGSASDLASRSGNVRLLSDRLDRVPLFFEIAHDVRRRIRHNLGFAFTFNSLGMALAALGFLTPVIAGLAMIASSLVVVRIAGGARHAPAGPDAPRPQDPLGGVSWHPAPGGAS